MAHDHRTVTPASSLVERLRNHVNNRGGASLQNGAWQMMLDAADEVERLREALRLTRRAMKEECDFITDELAFCSDASARMKEPPREVSIVPNSQAKTEVEG